MYQFPGTGFSETDSFHFLPLQCMVMEPNPRDARSSNHTKRVCVGTPVIIPATISIKNYPDQRAIFKFSTS